MLYAEFVSPHHVSLPNKSNLSFLHFNARSAARKGDLISCFLSEFSFKFSFIFVSETWYHEDCTSVDIDGYSLFVMNRINKRGGGVAIYTNNDNKCERICDYSVTTDDYEILTLRTGNQILSVLYRPPDGSIEKFLDCLEDLFDYANINNLQLACGGDFNMNVLENDMAHKLNIRLQSSGFNNLITTPTRVTVTTSSALDLLITAIETPVYSAGTIAYDISDHCPVFMICESKVNRINVQCKPFTFQYISDKALETFKEDVRTYDWSEVLASSNVDTAYCKFMEVFTRIYSSYFPMKTSCRSKKIRKPWVTPEHLKLIRNKNRSYFSFLKTRLEQKLKEFKTLRNKVNAVLRQAKNLYYQRLFSDICKKRPDAIWKTINNVLGRNKNSMCPDVINVNNTKLSGRALADYFNNFFVNVAIPHNVVSPTSSVFNYGIMDSIFLHPTDEAEVQTTITSLSNSKSLDADNLQVKPIKYVIEYIAPLLTHIYNLALESGIFPSTMKRAKVSVFYKGGDKNLATNYRPISILPVFSKGLEKIIFTRISNFLEKHNALTDAQFGFRKARSTETALLAMKETIVHNIENGDFTLGLFVDFSKAFDSLNHQILHKKLSSFGIRGTSLCLINSYLSNRSQFVCLNNTESCPLPIPRGVPQGSVLGPLLFNLYINDIVFIDEGVKFFIYADDSTVLVSGKDVNNLIVRCNSLLDRLAMWSEANCLRINVNKTKAVLFRARNKAFNQRNSLILNNNIIEVVNEHKLLGVWFSCHLSWDSHVRYVAHKLSSIAGAVSRCRMVMPVNVKLQIYYALFASQINYCSLVWGTTTKGNINKILLLQKRILRHIANVDRIFPTRNLFLQYNIIRFEHNYEFRILQSMYFCGSERQTFLHTLASLTPCSTSVMTRNSELWFIPYFRTQYKLQSLKHNLPVTLNKFKDTAFTSQKKLREYFINVSINN